MPFDSKSLRLGEFERSRKYAHMVGQKSESLTLERETGIEPALLAWEASALPLCYSRLIHL